METDQQIKNSVPSVSRFTHHVIFLIVVCLAGSIGCSTDQTPKPGRWEIVRRADWEARFYNVFFIDERTGWIVGNNAGSTFAEELDSVIAHTTDGGLTWHSQQSGVYHPLRAVQFVDNQTGWIVGENGVILHTKNGGEKWKRQSVSTYNNLFDLHFVSAQEGWIIGDFGTVLYTQDGGETWLDRSEGIGDNSLRGIFFLNSRQGWTVSHQGNAYYTRDGGKRWAYQRTNVRYELSDVHFVDENRGWIVGDKRTVLATQDGGRNWEFLTRGSNKRHEEQYGQQLRTGDEPLHTFLLYALHFADAENGWIVGDLGAILHTNDGGRTWKHQRGGATQLPGADVVLLGVHFVNSQLGWAVGEFGTIWHTTNSGRTWGTSIRTQLSAYRPPFYRR